MSKLEVGSYVEPNSTALRELAPDIPIITISAIGISATGVETAIGTSTTRIEIDETMFAAYESVALNVSWSKGNITPDASAYLNVVVTDMFFPRSAILLWVSEQSLSQFEYMNHDVIAQAYNTALGKLRSQVGNYYDLDKMLAVREEKAKDQTLRWILQVLTAHIICAPSMQVSEPLEDNYKEVANSIRELKGAQVSFEDGEMKQGQSTVGEIISSKKNYIG
ncbi:MAG: hypothetical protein RSF40_04830 [Oscillospiraceae bacterium]